ncbi:response regulator [Treponema primitia]|uniref:response regulator n=1 Tax=Treponema primitia TaxID=88058 RepID=UPI003980BC96
MTKQKTILAVDDMAENLTTLRAILQDYFDVRLAKTAKMALSLMENVQVDLILLDIEMPGMTGFQFLEENRKTNPKHKNIPVIFVTSHADPDMITAAINAGAKDYIVKPIKPDILLKKIDAIIGLPEKNSARNPLEVELNKLLELIAAADSAKAEGIAEELEQLAADQIPAIREPVQRIHTLVSRFDYEVAAKKIKELLEYLSNF